MITSEWQPWDDTMKRLVLTNPQDFVSWFLEEGEFVGFKSIELKNKTVRADLLLEVLQNEELIILNIEFQSTEDANMVQRLLEYSVLANNTHGSKIVSCVIYLRKASTIPVSPLEWKLASGRVILTFHFLVVKLWEVPADVIIKSGLTGLLPLLPLAKDGDRRESIETMIEEIIASQQFELLPLGKMCAGLVYQSEADQLWLERRFAVYKDIFEDSWVYQEILQKGIEQGVQKGIERGAEAMRMKALDLQRQTVLLLVQKRFPEQYSWAKQQLACVSDLEMIQQLTLQISLAKDSKAVFTALSTIPDQQPSEG